MFLRILYPMATVFFNSRTGTLMNILIASKEIPGGKPPNELPPLRDPMPEPTPDDLPFSPEPDPPPAPHEIPDPIEPPEPRPPAGVLVLER